MAALAGQAFSGPNPIRTFVIGVGRSLTSLNLVAEAGGTTQAFLTEVDSTLVDDFADALARIRTSALPCEYPIPETGDSGAIDPQQVNVWVTPEGAADSTLLPKIDLTGDAHCGAGQQAWYCDDPGAPTAVRLCPAACAAAEQQQVEVEFGCATATIR